MPPDYLAFLAGLNCFLLFLLCLALSGRQQERSFFLWLGCGAVLQWVHQWLTLLQPALAADVVLMTSEMVLLALTLASLGIGGILTWPWVWLRRLVLGLFILLALLVVIMGWLGWWAIFGPLCLSLGLTSSFLAGAGLWQLARRQQTFALQPAALALTGYGLSLLLLAPPEFLVFGTGVPQGTPWANWRDYLPLLQVAFTFFLTIPFWLVQQDELWRRQGVEGSRVWPRQIFVFVAAVFLLFGVGGMSVGLFARGLERDMREALLRRAQTVAAALPLATIRQLTGTAADQGTPAYQEMKRLFGRIQTAAKDCRFIYLLRFHDGQPVFLVDNEPEDSLDVSPAGQVFVEASAELKAMAEQPHALVEGPVTDRWGTWISAFEVIHDPTTGAFLALLGLDIDVRYWQGKIALQKLLPIGITLLMVISLIVFYLYQQKLLISTIQVAQSEERYRSLVEGTPNGVSLFDREGRCLAMNAPGLDMLQAEAAEVLGQSFLQHWQGEQQLQMQEAFARAREGQVVRFDTEITPADGSPRVWQIVLNPLKGKKGVVQGSVGILTDITERTQAERELRDSRALLQSLLDAIPDLLVVIDRDYRVIYSNRQGQCLIHNPGQASSCPICYRLFRGQETPCADCPAQTVFATGQTAEREEKHPTNERIDEIRSFPVYDSAGQVKMVVVYIRDITQRKQMEEALQTREAKLQSIFRAAPVGIGMVANRVLKEVNDRVCQMTGYAPEELVGQSARLLYPSQEDFDFVGREKYRQIAQRGVGTVETRWRRRDGRIIEVLLSSAPLWPQPPFQEILFTVMDITEKKKLEAARANLDKMESLGIMAGGIAHDFNNVLMAILGNISLIDMARTPAEAREGLRDAEEGCRQAMQLAKQLLTFAKGGAPVKRAADVKMLVEESVRLALSGAKAKTIFTWAPDLWDVNVDSGQMHQVFTNLLINADQAMPSGGQITIAAANCQVDEGVAVPLPPGHYVRLTVTDQGVGIAAEHLDKIFDPYFSTKQKGSGLGLATVYAILRQHGGAIFCESQLGQGTTFTLYIPALEQGGHEAPKSGKDIQLGQGRILVLEDDPGVQTVMARMLAKLGYEAVFAQEGQEVLDRYAAARNSHTPFGLVILDLTIPGGMGGLEALQILREEDPQVKAIVSSGYADDPVLADYRAYGFCGVLAKPYRLTDLSAVLHQVLA